VPRAAGTSGNRKPTEVYSSPAPAKFYRGQKQKMPNAAVARNGEGIQLGSRITEDVHFEIVGPRRRDKFPHSSSEPPPGGGQGDAGPGCGNGMPLGGRRKETVQKKKNSKKKRRVGGPLGPSRGRGARFFFFFVGAEVV